ncbi:MAG: hypothetical protein IMY73_01105 [Bacteroidetes bacterium]|nr:hypothetical protein [Bacteroidota bacterium]
MKTSMIFKFRVLSTENEEFIRDYELPYDATLKTFHDLITKDLKFEDNEMNTFFLSNENWEKLNEYTYIDMDLDDEEEGEYTPICMDVVLLGQIIHKKHERLLYVYDILNDSSLYITLMESKKKEEGEKYPKISTSKGEAPKKIKNDDDILIRKSAFSDIMEDFDDEFDGFGEEFEGAYEEEEYY